MFTLLSKHGTGIRAHSVCKGVYGALKILLVRIIWRQENVGLWDKAAITVVIVL
jgi:hypothetical protein